MSRFDHIKKQPSPRSLDEFIEGANNDEANLPKVYRRINKDTILLVGSGKVSNTNIYAKPPILLKLKKNLKYEIDKYCSGNMQIVLNYLIKRGLDDVIAKGDRIIEEAE